MNYDDQLDYEYTIHCLKTEINRMKREIRRLYTVENIDEGCVGCAGPCKVVDVSANLQKELDTTRDMYQSASDECGKRRKTIDELKDQNIKDLKELYELDKEDIDRLKNVVSAKDLSIKSLTTMCQSSALTRTSLEDTVREQSVALHYVKSNRDITYRKDRNVIAKLQCDIRSLEAELSAHKEDSAVLMKVVDAITMWNRSPIEPRRTISDIRIVVNDYVDLLEETPIDEDQDIAIVFTYGEIL